MRVEARPRLLKDIAAIRSRRIKQYLSDFLGDAEYSDIQSLMKRYDFKPLKDNGAFYRLRIEEYRLGCRYDRARDALILARVLHRGEIYKYFP